MGALHTARENEARKKFNLLQHQANVAREDTDTIEFSDPNAESVDIVYPADAPFHYGTHYSSAASVLHFMVRKMNVPIYLFVMTYFHTGLS